MGMRLLPGRLVLAAAAAAAAVILAALAAAAAAVGAVEGSMYLYDSNGAAAGAKNSSSSSLWGSPPYGHGAVVPAVVEDEVAPEPPFPVGLAAVVVGRGEERESDKALHKDAAVCNSRCPPGTSYIYEGRNCIHREHCQSGSSV